MKENKTVIVCGTDFSVAASQAANVAAALARKCDGRLLLIHAAEDAGVAAEPPEVGQAFLDAQRNELHLAAETLRSLGTEVEEAFVFGAADKALAMIATERRARMIVVAAVGRAKRLLMGSMAVRTAETAPVPTLVVRQGRRLTEWTEGRHKLHIVVGDDFSLAGDAALHFVADLTKLGPCEITVVHVDWPPEERQRLNLRGPVSLVENDPEVQRELEEKLAHRTHAFLGHRECTNRVVPCWGRADGYLLMLASDIGADLLVLGTHQRHGMERFRLGSVSRAVLNDALVSVAVVPMPRRAAVRSKRREQSEIPVAA
ncbi:MAG: universal stress protein [Chthoniobacterales bacterium]